MLQLIYLIFALIFASTADAQQVPDTTFTFPIRQAAYPQGKGPVIYIDGSHFNFHTRNGGFFPFSKLLEQDGYKVKSFDTTLTDAGLLKGCRLLVIVNALNEVNSNSWALPTPSAFSEKEISVLRKWVENGGSLLLVADHMPFAGAATNLGKAFGFEFLNGFARTGESFWPPSEFSAENGKLHPSPATTGIKEYEKIDRVTTFTGSAFKSHEGSMNVLCFSDSDLGLQPDTAWRFNPKTPTQKLNGFYQGSLLNFGKGRVAVFGEAAMFTAQVVNGSMRIGINSELAPQNAQFVLNLVHWLDGVKEYTGAVRK
ncbi:MAG: DUF4350 domain-containing protein [Bacteroidetes bacterium]|nr:DUF4350 domain-containing protein [Bacteroidota bacterium]